jgi:hypothetical protein
MALLTVPCLLRCARSQLSIVIDKTAKHFRQRSGPIDHKEEMEEINKRLHLNNEVCAPSSLPRSTALLRSMA